MYHIEALPRTIEWRGTKRTAKVRPSMYTSFLPYLEAPEALLGVRPVVEVVIFRQAGLLTSLEEHLRQRVHVARVLHLHQAALPMELPLLLGPVVLCQTKGERATNQTDN